MYYISLWCETVHQTSNWNDTEPTSTVFTVGTSSGTNGSSDNMIAYCWTEILEHSNFGKSQVMSCRWK